MRRDVKKFVFLGVEKKRKFFFERAQEKGFIHFINPKPEKDRVIPEAVHEVTESIRILRGLPHAEQEENYSLLNREQIIHDILALSKKSEELMEEEILLSNEIQRISNFGNFIIDDIDYIEKEGHRFIQFFTARTNRFDNEPVPEGLIFVNTDRGLDYFIAINPHPVAYDRMAEFKIDRSLSTIEERHHEVVQEIRNTDHELLKYAKYNKYLHEVLIDRLNEYHLTSTEDYVQITMEDSLFAIEGWVPEDMVDRVTAFCDMMDVYLDEIAIEPSDDVPTFLENSGMGRWGEDLINIYDTPSATDKDPSLWVLIFFTFFFAFIVNDAGYGLIYLAIALFCKYKFPNVSKATKRFLNMMTFMSIGCVIWGAMVTSFFNVELAPDNPLRKVSLLDWIVEKKAEYHIEHKDATYQYWVKEYPKLAQVKDPHQFVGFKVGEKKPILLRFADNVLFEMALFIGVIHLMLSCLRYAHRNIPLIGWAFFLAGAYLYFGEYLKQPSFMNFLFGIPMERGGEAGFVMLIGGMAFAWISAIFLHGLRGLEEGTKVIQIFADTLSYLRLYALALAGAIVAATINEVASSVPLFLAVLLTVTSHAVNLLLSTMSGVIHGLRLNFLEWYHYSFEGGGKEFQPLKLMKME